MGKTPASTRLVEEIVDGYRSGYDTARGQILIEDIKLARCAAGWSQRTLAERIGTSAQTIKRMERGSGSVATLLAALTALDFQLSGLGPGRTLTEQIRNRRLRKGLSLDEAASRAGLARNTVASLERGGGSIASLLRLLSATAPGARRRAPERTYWGQGRREERDVRFTPPDFLEHVREAFGHISLDPCAHESSAVVADRRILLSAGGDGLRDEWSGRLAFVNPPFSNLLAWLRRAHEQWFAHRVETVVCLVPVRTDSAWFHDTLSAHADIYLIRGRVRFLDAEGGRNPTPFSLMLVTLGASDEQRMRFAQRVPGFWVAKSPAPHVIAARAGNSPLTA